MATWEDVRRLVDALPEVTEHGSDEAMLAWKVKAKAFAWERPLRKGDYAALGDAAPRGTIMAASVPDLGAKQALVAEGGDVYFTTPHFDGYKAILVQLEHIAPDELAELLVEAWLARAPKRLAEQYLKERSNMP